MRKLFKGELPQAVLFDLDGTLIDSVPDLGHAVDRMLQRMGLVPVGETAVRQWVGNGAQMLVKRALVRHLNTEGAVLNPAVFDHAYQLFLEFYRQKTAERSVLYPGVSECLLQLQAEGVKMAVVTNKPMQFTTPMLDGFGLSGYFDCILGGDSLAVKKPDPQPLQHAMKVLGSTPQTTLMVGDSVNDLQAARAAGCPVICVPYGYNHGNNIADSKPDMMVEQLDHMLR
ncbi:MAG: phosphoglycolate phosphatase [Marinobacterium sp.]|nr:phosphoglycolate phosphatase [Marinobacterium sp.]